MILYCTIDNYGYGEVTNLRYSGTDDLFIDILFKNQEKAKTFSFNYAVGKTLFVDDKKNPDDNNNIWEMICDELGKEKIDELIMQIKQYDFEDNKEKIHDMLENSFRFEGFMHETTIKNLASILKDGKIKPRNELVSFEDSANNEVICHTSSEVKNSVRFYFYKKTPTNYQFDDKNPNNMAYIVFKWDLVDIDGATFVNGNASSEYSESKGVKEYFENPGNFMDWANIFHRGYLSSYEECICFGGFEEKRDIIRKRNAEINIPRSVETDYIDKIVFKTEEEYERFIKILDNDIILSKFKDKITIDRNYFN